MKIIELIQWVLHPRAFPTSMLMKKGLKVGKNFARMTNVIID